MDDDSVISADVIADYAADAAREVVGVVDVVEGPLRRRGVRVHESDGVTTLAIHVEVASNTDIRDVGAAVQERVRGYLTRMTAVTPASIDIVVDAIAAPED